MDRLDLVAGRNGSGDLSGAVDIEIPQRLTERCALVEIVRSIRSLRSVSVRSADR